MSIKKVYRAHINHLGEGHWKVDYDEYDIIKETETRYYYKGSDFRYNKELKSYHTHYNIDKWFNKGAKNSVFETKEEALANLIFRRKRMQEYLDYKMSYNSAIIELLESGVTKAPSYF